jgi:hypothetical protein
MMNDSKLEQKFCTNIITHAQIPASFKDISWNDMEHYDTLCTKKAFTHSKNITQQPKLLAR